MKPWDGIVTDTDIASFAGGFDKIDRPLDAGAHPALVIIDMTRAFVDGAYPTGHSETGYPAAAANARLLTAARQAGIPVFFTKGFADPTYEPAPAEQGMWKRAPGASRMPLLDLPPGDVIVDELTPVPGEIVIDKGSKPSGFFGTQLTSHLVYEKVDTVIVTGMTTSGCVRATAVDAFQYNFRVILPHECCADRSQISHAVSLFDMHMKYADVVSTDETIEYVRSLRVPAAV